MAQKVINKEKGSGYVELSIIIPLILFLIFGAIELGRALKAHSSMNVIARGLANTAFRECANKISPSSAKNCLDSVISSSSLVAKSLLPNATLIVSIYKWDKKKPVFVAISPEEKTVEQGARNPASKFSLSFFDPSINPDSYSMLENNRIIVFGEVYFPYDSLLPITPGIFNLSKSLFYVATAY